MCYVDNKIAMSHEGSCRTVALRSYKVGMGGGGGGVPEATIFAPILWESLDFLPL